MPSQANDSAQTYLTLKADTVQYDAGDFVACTYSDNWYMGEIVAFDNVYEVNFMQKSQKLTDGLTERIKFGCPVMKSCARLTNLPQVHIKKDFWHCRR